VLSAAFLLLRLVPVRRVVRLAAVLVLLPDSLSPSGAALSAAVPASCFSSGAAVLAVLLSAAVPLFRRGAAVRRLGVLFGVLF
jgi:hypothetical protein